MIVKESESLVVCSPVTLSFDVYLFILALQELKTSHEVRGLKVPTTTMEQKYHNKEEGNWSFLEEIKILSSSNHQSKQF